MQVILVTGAVGFIGFHLTKQLLKLNYRVIGIDNINNYYEVSLKMDRLKILEEHDNNQNFEFHKTDISIFQDLASIVEETKPQIIIHLAAQAGVRYSIENPEEYFKSNVLGFFNILEISRIYKIEHLLFASSSSVYGNNSNIPFKIKDAINQPMSFYAATKGSNELMAYSYANIYRLQITALRFFTVYGEWGRPDMAYMIFAKKIMEGNPIKIFNNGAMTRDFTYIDDIVKCIYLLLSKKRNEDSKIVPYTIFNLGNSKPIKLIDFILELEDKLDKRSIKVFENLQKGDMLNTEADTTELEKEIMYTPNTSIDKGLTNFTKWFKIYYNFE